MTPCYRSSMMGGTIFYFIWRPFVRLSNSLHLNIGLVLTHEIKWFDLRFAYAKVGYGILRKILNEWTQI